MSHPPLSDDQVIRKLIEKVKAYYGEYVYFPELNNYKIHIMYPDNDLNHGQKRTSITVECTNPVSFYAGAHALYKITGQNIGINKEQWISWLQNNNNLGI